MHVGVDWLGDHLFETSCSLAWLPAVHEPLSAAFSPFTASATSRDHGVWRCCFSVLLRHAAAEASQWEWFDPNPSLLWQHTKLLLGIKAMLFVVHSGHAFSQGSSV